MSVPVGFSTCPMASGLTWAMHHLTMMVRRDVSSSDGKGRVMVWESTSNR
jgi:hypothetical protein